MKNNYQRLKEEADIGMVLAYLNVPVQRKGSSYFLQCPNPEHNDAHFTNCYYKDGWNNVYCCACGKNMKALDIIMWQRGCSYGEAADLLWEIEGRPDWYYSREKNKGKRKPFKIDREELAIIGIHLPSRVLLPHNISDVKETLEKGTQYDNTVLDGYLLCDVAMGTYRDFMSEKQFIHLVQRKAQECFEKTESTAGFFRNILKYEEANGIEDANTKYLYQSSLEKMKILKKLFERAKSAAA